jgi:glycosyltransferase involved in cell wall biosynthesis
MKIIVYPHELSIGGSQINAIDLAASIAAKGNEVIVYGTDGPLVPYVRDRGLKFVRAFDFKYRPAPPKVAQLMSLARREKADLIHTYEWPPCLDAYLGAGLFGRVPVLATILDMTLSPFVPPSLPLIMGTAELAEAGREARPGPVWAIEPPIDIERDNPGIDGSAFRQRLALGAGELLAVIVSRLAVDLKLDSLVRAIDAIDAVAGRYPVRLAIVGGGPAHEALLKRARSVNERHGREVVTLLGEDSDPRSAYAAADIVLGMGSSALRALSIGRPLIVQGEGGFSRVLDETSAPLFLHQGFYGIGDGRGDPLADQIMRLLDDAQLRFALGRMGREIVEAKFSLEHLSGRLLDVYETVVRQGHASRLTEVAGVLGKAFGREFDNHVPRNKQHKHRVETAKLSAAAGGAWPPTDVEMMTQ